MSRESDFRALEKVERWANRMDRAFRLPGTRIRFGWDSIVGLIPGLGDTAAVAPAAYIISTAHRVGAPSHLLVRMGANVGVDWLIGLVPLAGDILDVGYKSNTRNARLLRAHLEERHGPSGMKTVN